MNLTKFKTDDFYSALKSFFNSLNVPLDYISKDSVPPSEILKTTFKTNSPSFKLINDVYFLGIVDDAVFEGNKGFAPEKIKADYDGILIFGITLHKREKELLPTRSQLAEITRALNREFHYTPVVVVFKYSGNDDNYIAFASAERIKYKQDWREGEKAGKISLLKDIDISNPHSGHLRILQNLKIVRSGPKAVRTFADLYKYWQEVLSVSILNKQFYQELSFWYFWAIKNVRFPNEPKNGEELKTHRAQNIIRLITRLIFIWFIKEKKLIPETLFDKQKLDSILDFGNEGDSNYYKAVLQNLFFATLNQEMNKREFRKNGNNRGAFQLYRYEKLLKDKNKFIELTKNIPFLNGGLFECLDSIDETKKGKQGGDVFIRIDGFSDHKNESPNVPNFLFFGEERIEDLSEDFGQKNKKYKQAKVKPLLTLLNEYKFTIAENTTLEEEIALDPELLGKVFENLLASYNPETKTTARKQTGSFYTPREIVNYMVDEILIAYLKNAVLKEEQGYVAVGEAQTNLLGNEGKSGQLSLQEKLDPSPYHHKEEELNKKLHILFGFNDENPFKDDETTTNKLIKAIDNAKILDPACGSGAFPMGILHKMVHILHKLDPNNKKWKERQINKVKETEKKAEEIEDTNIRDALIKDLEKSLEDIEEAFENNELDYGRKLYLIENCIYGVDIQPIATQIAKLRFFISLIVDQRPDKNKKNLGIRPLPNLETKFVAANTLIGLEKPSQQTNLFENTAIEKLKKELLNIRHRHFNAKTPKTKRKWREKDKELRQKIGQLLENDGWAHKSAIQVANWNPYDQNTHAEFFDPEWMFGIKGGFDVVIGNPPYVQIQKLPTNEKKILESQNYHSFESTGDIYMLFYEKGWHILKSQQGILTFITSNSWLQSLTFRNSRKFAVTNWKWLGTVIVSDSVFTAVVNANIMVFSKSKNLPSKYDIKVYEFTEGRIIEKYLLNSEFITKDGSSVNISLSNKEHHLLKTILSRSSTLSTYFKVFNGVKPFEKGKGIPPQTTDILKEKPFVVEGKRPTSEWRPLLRGSLIHRYQNKWDGNYWILYGKWLAAPRSPDIFNTFPKIAVRQTGDSLIGTIISEDFIMRNNLHIVIPQNSTYSLECCLAVINSKLMDWVYCTINPEKGEALAEVKKNHIESLPLIEPTQKCTQIITQLVKITLFTKKTYSNNLFSISEQIIDALVFELYFPDHMKEREIDILKFVGKDIKEIVGNRDFEKLKDSEKEEIINKLHARWTHPESEVNNRMKLFTVRSTEILKPIIESTK